MNPPRNGPRPVLFGYDGSDEAARAISEAGKLLPGGQALVAHTWIGLSHYLLTSGIQGLTGPIVDAAEELDAADQERAEKVAAEGTQLAIAAGFEAHPLAVHEVRNPWRTLLDCAAAHDASATIVGSRGQSTVKGAILGSVSASLVHHAEGPVLVVPSDKAEDRSGPILLCYDGSEDAREAVCQAGTLFAGREAIVLRMWESWKARSPYVPLMSGAVKGMATELDEMAETRSSDLADEGADLARSAGLDAAALSRRAEVSFWRTVLDVAVDRDVAAIVLGSRGLTGVAAALGSVSHGVLHHSHRPVLIVPPTEENED